MSNYSEESTLPGAAPIGRLAPSAPRDDAATGDPADAPTPSLLQRVGSLVRGGVAPWPADAAPVARTSIFGGVGRWEWPVLAAVLAVAAGLNFFGLSHEGYANTYYAAAVRSMMMSWHNFFFVSFDPGGFVTVDKPPAGFWIQTISAKIFGFHGWSILLPQALAGVLSVALLWWLVRRAWGPLAGLIAGLALAVTPISVVTNRNNTIDSLLVLCVLGAVWALTRAIESPRHPLRWLLLAATLVGVGFNIKMLEAYLVLPALWLAYLVIARPRWYMRVAHLALATIVLVAVSLSWAVAVDLTPADQRPYVGSSQTNSVLELALGYNGLQRLLGRSNSNDTSLGAIITTVTAQQSGGGAAGAVGGGNENGPKGLLRLLNQQLGGQIGWTVPLAVLGIAAAAWQVRPRRLRFWRFTTSPSGAGILRRRRASLLIWGMWFFTMAVFFSYAGFYHRYYLTMLAPGVAALVGLGAVGMWLAWRARGWFGLLGIVLPVALVGTALVQRSILTDYPEWHARLAAPVLAVTIAAAAVLAVAWLLRHWAGRWAMRLAQAALVIGLVGLLITPAVWSGISVKAASEGMASNLPAAGPNGGGGFGGGGQARGGNVGAPPAGFAPVAPNQVGGNQTRTGGNGTGNNRQPNATGGATTPPNGQATYPGGAAGNRTAPGAPGAIPNFGGAIPPTGAVPAQAFGGGMGQLNGQMLQWLIAHQGNARFLVAVSSSMQASSVIIEQGLAVMATGGFSGGDPILDAESLAQLVKDGTVRYFLGGGGGGFGGTSSFSVNSWVSQHCTAVPATEWGGTGTSQLYDCGTAK